MLFDVFRVVILYLGVWMGLLSSKEHYALIPLRLFILVVCNSMLNQEPPSLDSSTGWGAALDPTNTLIGAEAVADYGIKPEPT
jgi:hypothetical protein